MLFIQFSQLSVGRMHYSHAKKRSIVDKEYGFHSQGIFLLSFLQKAQQELFPEQSDSDGEYFISDANGVSIASDDTLRLQKSDGEQHEVPWTIQGYLKASGIRFRSKARFYCVQKMAGTFSINVIK